MLIYIAGKYSGTPEEIQANIEHARRVAIRLWEMGHAAFCPHLNTARFELDCAATYDQYISGDLNILARCDALVLLEGWQESRGAKIEADYAKNAKVPIYHESDLLCGKPELHPTEVSRPKQAEAFRIVLGQMYRTHLDKNADYSPANVLGTGFVGLITRLWDKTARLLNLTGFNLELAHSAEYTAPKTPKGEAIEDTLLDLSVYAIIGLLLRAGVWGK